MGLSYSYCWHGNGFVEKVTTWTPQRKETRETTGCWKRRVRKTKVEQLWREVKRDVRKLQRKKITWNRKQVFTPTPVGKMPKTATNNNNILKKRAYNTTHKLKKRLLKFLQCNNDIVLGDNWNQRKNVFMSPRSPIQTGRCPLVPAVNLISDFCNISDLLKAVLKRKFFSLLSAK